MTGTPTSVPRRTSILLVAVCLVLVAGIVAVVLSARPGPLGEAGNGQVTSQAYRSAALSAASASTAAVFSYSYRTLADDEKAARAVMTKDYVRKYDETMAEVGPKATKSKLTQKATVMATSLISIKEGSAKALVFVNRVTSREGSKNQQLSQDRLLVTMKRDDGDWIVSKIDTF